MRLWSLHPRYLDARGLVALWREALLAQAVLKGRTKGYVHHPQLRRFRDTRHPVRAIAAYLLVIHDEATRRGYGFDSRKIGRGRDESGLKPIPVTRGQIRYEWDHLLAKLAQRAPKWMESIETKGSTQASPIFCIVPGGVEPWEKWRV